MCHFPTKQKECALQLLNVDMSDSENPETAETKAMKMANLQQHEVADRIARDYPTDDTVDEMGRVERSLNIAPYPGVSAEIKKWQHNSCATEMDIVIAMGAYVLERMAASIGGPRIEKKLREKNTVVVDGLNFCHLGESRWPKRGRFETNFRVEPCWYPSGMDLRAVAFTKNQQLLVVINVM